MRRAIQVFGCKLDNGKTYTIEGENIVSIKVYPDKSVELIKPSGDIQRLNNKWVSYIPRFN